MILQIDFVNDEYKEWEYYATIPEFDTLYRKEYVGFYVKEGEDQIALRFFSWSMIKDLRVIYTKEESDKLKDGK